MIYHRLILLIDSIPYKRNNNKSNLIDTSYTTTRNNPKNFPSAYFEIRADIPEIVSAAPKTPVPKIFI